MSARVTKILEILRRTSTTSVYLRESVELGDLAFVRAYLDERTAKATTPAAHLWVAGLYALVDRDEALRRLRTVEVPHDDDLARDRAALLWERLGDATAAERVAANFDARDHAIAAAEGGHHERSLRLIRTSVIDYESYLVVARATASTSWNADGQRLLRDLETLVERDGKSVERLLELAETYLALAAAEDAKRLVERFDDIDRKRRDVVDNGLRSSRVYLRAARIMRDAGDFEGAAALLNDLRVVGRDDPEARPTRGASAAHAFAIAGDHDEAERIARLVEAAQPTAVDALEDLVCAWIEIDRPQSFERARDMASRIAPPEKAAPSWLALARYASRLDEVTR